MSKLKEHLFCECDEIVREYRGQLSNEMRPYYLKSEADKVIAEKDAEIAMMKDRSLDVKNAAHVLKAFKFYLCQLTHCAYDERTAQWIIDNWEQDYKRIEAYK